ncbi:MAG TPA: DUF2141 domain-containing protein [Caulobacteraceae bacterium]|nr:DUF2141 domain-containing protein [Caulobacteraceae bacterium]
MRAWLSGLLAVLAVTLARPAPAATVDTLPCHGAPSSYKLLVTTTGLRSDHGYLVANLYGPERKKWLAENGWLAVWRDPAMRGEETMCLYLPAPGRYALVMFHDANADGDLNMGPFGPKEGFAFSNNIIPILTAPSLSSALFTVGPGETHVTIRLRYPPIM